MREKLRVVILMPFLPSGLIIFFFLQSGVGGVIRSSIHVTSLAGRLLRVVIGVFVYGYPLFWLAALVLTIMALIQKRSKNTLVGLAVAPFLFATIPFILADFLPAL